MLAVPFDVDVAPPRYVTVVDVPDSFIVEFDVAVSLAEVPLSREKLPEEREEEEDESMVLVVV